MEDGQPGIGTDRALTLLHLRKKFSASLKDSDNAEFDKLLPLFNRIMSMFTPDELAAQFKELISFTQRVCETIVAEIRQRASLESTLEAATAVADFAQPLPPDARGWVLLKSVAFILNSGMPKVLEPICRSQLPSTLAKTFYLFFDLPPLSDADSPAADVRRKMYDLLVTLMNSLCEYSVVATELIQRDDLNWLFVGASTQCAPDSRIWRDAQFTFLSSILGRALSTSVIKYIHSKGCVGHYLRNCRAVELTAADRTSLLCNMLDLLRHSAGTTSALIDDFKNADGYERIAALCTSADASADHCRQLLHTLVGLLTAGEAAVPVAVPSASLSFHNFKLPATAAHGSSAVRVPDAFRVLEKCFRNGNNDICLLVLEKISYLYKAEKLNYFIVERTHSLHLFVELMANKNAVVQEKILELLEFILRELNFIPFKELSALNAHAGRLAGGGDSAMLRRYFAFFFRILPVNINVKDAIRELAILETLLNVVHKFCADWSSADEERGAVAQMAMDLLVASAKGNVANAQFITENLEIRALRIILLPPSLSESDPHTAAKWRDDFCGSTLLLVKNLLFLAKNEQLFSSLLQLLFAEPGNIPLCDVVLKLFTSVLLESHKVRVMFRRSGGYICLMTLLLHVENALRLPTASPAAVPLVMRHISLIFRVLTVSMRYEPSNAKYFQTEMKPSIINSILRCLGCFTSATRISNTNRDIWERVHADDNRPKLSTLHYVFRHGVELYDFDFQSTAAAVPPQLLHELTVLRLLFDLALDNYEKPSNVIQWAADEEWLASAESVKVVPLVSFSARTILVHPTAVTCFLQMVPAMSADPTDIPLATAGSKLESEIGIYTASVESAGTSNDLNPAELSSKAQNLDSSTHPSKSHRDPDLSLWTSTAQFYMALVLKALMRIERNQQIMCQHDMPKILLDVGTELFKAERHPLLPPFYYLFERLACQSMHPRELRRFLRLDRPLCCLNLDEDSEDEDGAAGPKGSGGPLPIHRVKALVSMLTPRNHALVHAPAFVEFNLSIEGFACLFVPSISNIVGPSTGGSGGGGALSFSSTSERLFPPLSGITFMTWFYVDDQPANNAASCGITNVQNSNICLLTIVRNFEGTEASAQRHNKKEVSEAAPNLENHLTCFYVHLNMMQRCLLISTAEHSVVDELRKDFVRPPETFVRVPLSEQFFQTRQWTHLAVVLSKALLKQSQVDVYINGRCLLSQRLAYIPANVGGAQAQIHDSQPVHALVGTPPFLRRPSHLRWKIATLYLIEEPLTAEAIHQVIRLQPHYIGNLQMAADGNGGAAIVAEEKLILVLNASSTTELTAHALRPMLCRGDCEVIASLLGISANDNSTPLRVLWNTASHANGGPRALGGVLIGYLGMRTFAPCPVSALLDAIGGAAPLFGLVAMCADAPALYAALKALTSAVRTNRRVVQALTTADGGARGYQTLAALLEEKAHLLNAHILQLVLALAGTTAEGSDQHPGRDGSAISDPQTFDDLLCDLDVWASASDDVKRLLFEHLYELLIDDHSAENLKIIRGSSLFGRLLILLYENRAGFPVLNDVLFRLVAAIVRPSPEPEPALLLRLGQTISATISRSSRANGDATSCESDLPFHIAELERMLIDSLKVGDDSAGNDSGLVDSRIYAVYLRNRLLNIVMTMLAHADGATHARLCEQLAATLGFGWLLALCAPGINAGTLYLALRILLNLLRYQPLMEKFRDGTANSGWLSDADSVIRNRAAVLLGFSVSAHGGAVGAKVDINPELSNCSGFAALEHLMYAHADKPFVYLAILAILFNRPQANVQPLDEFTIDAIWSHIFAMDEKGSVSDVLASVQFCGDALIALLAMVRAGVQRQRREPTSDDGHWAHSHPLIVGRLLTFLYRNSEPFVGICHTETFVVALFSALAAASPSSGVCGLPVSSSASADREKGFSRSVVYMLNLLTNILYDDLSLPHETRTEWPFHALVEFLIGGGSMCSSQSIFYTELVNGCLERLLAPDGTSPFEPANVAHFLAKLIDSVWYCLYRGNPIRILKCALRLAADAPAIGGDVAHVNALFRIVLYLLSRPIDNVDTQMSVLDTLAEIVRNQQLLLGSRHAANNNPLYYGALIHLVFMLSERLEAAALAGSQQDHLERGNAQVAMCAQNVWGLLWAQKKALIDELFKRDVDLDLYTTRTACGAAANSYWLQFVDAQTDCHGSGPPSPNELHATSANNYSGSFAAGLATAAVAAGSRVNANVGQLQQNLQSRLSRAAKTGFQRLANRQVFGGSVASLSGGVAAPVGLPTPFQFERLKIESETFYMWIRVHISILHELIATQCQRYHEWHAHVRSWCLKEWQRTEAELTRERGLWGPERRSLLDKYELDVTEGPHRIRRKLVPNSAEFYRRYPYRPHLDGADAKALRGKLAVSRDSRAYYERMRKRRFHTIDERIIDRTAAAASAAAGGSDESGASTTGTGVELNASTELNLSMIKRMVQKNLAQAAAVTATDTSEKSPPATVAADAIDDDATSISASDALSADGDSDKLSEVTRRDTSDTISEPPSPSRHLSGRSGGSQPPRTGSGASGSGPDNQTLLRLLEQGEQLHSMFRCARIQGLDTLEGLLLFGRDHYYVVDGFTLLKTREIRDLDFLPEQFHDPIVPYMAMGSSNRPATKSNRQCSKFSYDDIKEVHKRRYLLQPIALEVFSADGRNYLLAFPRKIRDRVFQKFVSMAKSASSDVARTMAEQRKLLPAESASTGHQLINQLMGQQSMTQKWQRGEISNFQYLIYLNTLAGRSYNDLSQYPVFPWIVANYDSPRLDLTDPRSFRDLSKPMGAQSTERLAKFLRRYREWDDPSGDTPPYMYGTHYSSAMIVLSYLVRLEPFTEQFLKLQGGHFDLADRMFHSVRDAFISASRNNMADVRELIPEFFYLPEMFHNDNNFDLGVKQNGIALHHVELPVWAHGDPHEFVRLHREALECDYVSEHLHEWIDLIFGYRQSGDTARDANNVFHHLFYEANVNFDVIDDPLTRNATLGFINNFGQIPSQLFRKPHPQKRVTAVVSPPPAGSGGTGQNDGAIAAVLGITTTRLFYHALEALRVSAKPVKELKAAVGDIVVNDKNQVIVLEQGKIFLPPASYLAWSFNDRSVRMGGVGTEKSECVCETSDVYEITCMATVNGRTIFVGLTTGTVLVWSTAVAAGGGGGNAQQLATSGTLATRKALDAHTDVVTALTACAPHNFVVSASRDHTAVVWHLTRFAFIRQLDGHPAAVTAVAVNDTTGDIATASNAFIFVWTVNGMRIATINTAVDAGGLFASPLSVVLCLSFSTMNEWDLNNVVMCGTSDGLVKIYSIVPTLAVSGGGGQTLPAQPNPCDAAAEVREHILRRQQRIQQHHNHYQQGGGAGATLASVASIDSASQTSSPVGWTLRASVKPGNAPPPLFNDAANASVKRVARLRRVLHEHTAFNQDGNALPAPVTSIRATRDHRSLLVGDGIGRVWLWTVGNQLR